MYNLKQFEWKGVLLMLNILIAEDDSSLLDIYQIVLEKENYTVFTAEDGMKAWEILEKQHIDLLITDIMMPHIDGCELISLLRQNNSNIPILMITVKDDFSSKSKGFLLGADDYMIKPVDLKEMILRVHALLRRAHINQSHLLAIGNTSLDYDALTVTQDQESFMLPPKEFFLLYKLLSYPNKIFTRLQLMDDIWGKSNESDAQTVDVHINRLRKHFQNSTDFEIVTVRGLGYKAVIL